MKPDYMAVILEKAKAHKVLYPSFDLGRFMEWAGKQRTKKSLAEMTTAKANAKRQKQERWNRFVESQD